MPGVSVLNRAALTLLAIASMGCDALRDELPGLYAAAPRAALEQPKVVQTNDPVPQLARRIEQHLQPPALPELDSLERCSQAQLPTLGDGKAERIVLVAIDARRQTKNLIPRRVTERLESGERMLVAASIDAHSSSESAQRPFAVPASASSLTLEDLKRIEQQRYLGVFYLMDYQGPSLILRVGKIRREWFSGNLSARFVLIDTQAQKALCGTALRVTNDVQSAPIRSRLQSETRARLERELGDAIRAAAGETLVHWRSVLTWPDAS